MTDQTTETRVAEIEKRAVDALGIGAFGKAGLVCRSDIPWLTAQLRAAWKMEAALREALQGMLDHACVADAAPEDVDEEDRARERVARTALQETADER